MAGQLELLVDFLVLCFRTKGGFCLLHLYVWKGGDIVVNTYDSYLKEPKSMALEQMQNLHMELMNEIGKDSDALELYNQLCKACESYMVMRAKWQRMSREEKLDQDSLRTSYHDSVIIHFNMLARYLRMKGKKAEWRDKLGDEKADQFCRKSIGDFGCYIVFVNSICSR